MRYKKTYFCLLTTSKTNTCRDIHNDIQDLKSLHTPVKTAGFCDVKKINRDVSCQRPFHFYFTKLQDNTELEMKTVRESF